MGAKEDREDEIAALAALAFSRGYADGMASVASEFDLEEFVEAAGARLPDLLDERAKLIRDSLDYAKSLVDTQRGKLEATGATGPILEGQLKEFAHQVAIDRAELIAETEATAGRYAGAKALAEESGKEFEWRFPHFDFNGDDECWICEAIRQNAPYSTEEAIDEGYPMLPHPRCDHGWTMVEVGDDTLTEIFNG